MSDITVASSTAGSYVGESWFSGWDNQRWSAEIRIASLVFFILAAIFILMVGLFLGLYTFDGGNGDSSTSNLSGAPVGPIQISNYREEEPDSEPILAPELVPETDSQEFVPENVFEKGLPEIQKDIQLSSEKAIEQETQHEMDPDEIKA